MLTSGRIIKILIIVFNTNTIIKDIIGLTEFGSFG